MTYPLFPNIPEPVNELKITDDEYYTISSALLQSYNIFTDPDGYVKVLKEKFKNSEGFREENRTKVLKILMEHLDWADPKKNFVDLEK